MQQLYDADHWCAVKVWDLCFDVPFEGVLHWVTFVARSDSVWFCFDLKIQYTVKVWVQIVSEGHQEKIVWELGRPLPNVHFRFEDCSIHSLVFNQPWTFRLLSRADMLQYCFSALCSMFNDKFPIGLIICCYFRPQGPALVVSSRQRLMKCRSSSSLSQHLLWNTCEIQIFASPETQYEPRWAEAVSAWLSEVPHDAAGALSTVVGFGFPLDQGARRIRVLYIGVS